MVSLILIVAGVRHFSHHGAGKRSPPWPGKIGESLGEVTVNPKDGLKYLWVPAGTFAMGCSPGDKECQDDEKPSHQVTITKGFWMAQTPITVGGYKRFAGVSGRRMPPQRPAPDTINFGWWNDAMPIVDVSWEDAQAYCSGVGGRLPTEAEWEYAARAQSTTARYGPIDDVAWYADNSGQQRLDSTLVWNENNKNYEEKKYDQLYYQRLYRNGSGVHEVGLKQANSFGLFDMLGNVSEWTNDWYGPDYYKDSPLQDPQGPSGGQWRVLRGGSWESIPAWVRVSYRGDRYDWARSPGFREDDLGFRCAGRISDH
ncbi:MAG: formylglycine-generating enzyme family protein [Terriglobia bacterium]